MKGGCRPAGNTQAHLAAEATSQPTFAHMILWLFVSSLCHTSTKRLHLPKTASYACQMMC